MKLHCYLSFLEITIGRYRGNVIDMAGVFGSILDDDRISSDLDVFVVYRAVVKRSLNSGFDLKEEIESEINKNTELPVELYMLSRSEFFGNIDIFSPHALIIGSYV